MDKIFFGVFAFIMTGQYSKWESERGMGSGNVRKPGLKLAQSAMVLYEGMLPKRLLAQTKVPIGLLHLLWNNCRKQTSSVTNKSL